MIVLNFAHPLTGVHLESLENLSGQTFERVLDLPTHFDPAESFVDQARCLIDSVGLSATEWQTVPMIVNLPTLHVIAALVIAEIHGRCGYFPTIVRLRPVEGITPQRYEVAELLNLQAVRDAARAGRIG